MSAAKGFPSLHPHHSPPPLSRSQTSHPFLTPQSQPSASMNSGLRPRAASASFPAHLMATNPSLFAKPQVGRTRSSSIVSVQEIKENYESTLDQGALKNLNADWVNYKGAWLIHLVLIAVGKVLVDILPGIEQDTSWTIVLQGYNIITYVMFHYVTGTPFEGNNGGVYDRLTLWEQIDQGAQYTPAKKWLTILPILLFLLSTHYTRYDLHPTLFTINFLSLLLISLAPKLPALHRLRFKFFDFAATPSMTPDERSGPPTPIEAALPGLSSGGLKA